VDVFDLGYLLDINDFLFFDSKIVMVGAFVIAS